MLMQNFGATIKKHYGMLWYFLEWPIGILGDAHIFSFDSSDKTQISATYKAVMMNNNYEMWIDGQNHVSNYAL